MFNVAISMLMKVLMSMAKSLLTEKFIKWAILELAEMLVKSTENTADDKWLVEIRKHLN